MAVTSTNTISDNSNTVTCKYCGKSWDKTKLNRSCSNCFACTGCEAYICPECRYEIVITPPRPMNWKKTEE